MTLLGGNSMSFSDIFKRSFLEGYVNIDISPLTVFSALMITCLISLYIFFVYRVITRKTIYSKNFNISLCGIAVTTAAIILTIQSSLVVSLGMVGALSIVRFRTAIKDPIDLMFLFWSISVGIICGAGLAMIAIVLSLIMSVGIVILNNIPIARAPMILIINSTDIEIEDKIINVIGKYAKYYAIKARNIRNEHADLTIELRTSKAQELVKKISEIDSVTSASILEHNGEASF